VRAPTGQVFCADDTWGNNPGVDIVGAMPGQYEVFVGTWGGGFHPYTVGFSELRSSVPGGAVTTAVTTPVTPVVVQQAPPPVVQQPPPVVVQQPPPVVVQQPPPVVVQQPPPVVVQQPQYVASVPLASGFLPDPRVFTGLSGGIVRAQSINPACGGYISPTPNHTLTLTTPFNFLRIWARSDGDTTLFVRTPTGQVFCADDTYGLNPGVDLRGLPPGTYQVFVGSYSATARYPYELGVTELTSSVPGGVVTTNAALAVPTVSATFGSTSLTSGFLPDPQYLSGQSGGPISAQALSPQCRGYIAAQPDHVVYLNSPFSFLRIFVNSSSDTTLFVRGPRGELYCADDTFGLNPGVDLVGAAPGAYQVFVGSYSAGNHAPYSLGLTELSHVRP
jgi:hypothetical protein